MPSLAPLSGPITQNSALHTKLCQLFSRRQPHILFSTVSGSILGRGKLSQTHNARMHISDTCRFEAAFFEALARAGSCRHHQRRYSKASGRSTELTPKNGSQPSNSRSSLVPPKQITSGSVRMTDSQTPQRRFSTKDYIDLVDFYPEPVFPLSNPSDLPRFTWKMAEKSEKKKNDIKGDTSIMPLQDAIDEATRAIEDETNSNEAIFRCYAALPSPGVKYLPAHSRTHLLRRLSILPHKSERGLVRYMSLVEDMRAAGIPLSLAQWNSAIYLTCRSFADISSTDVDNALRLWREMEHEYQVRGNTVTFNILFDIAVKAGQFSLADILLKEMEDRELEPERFTHVSNIYYHGRKGDGNGLRQAYKQLVMSGEIVDTPVLNATIVSLLQAGEPAAAESIYDRMKQLFKRTSDALRPAWDWKTSRELGRIVKCFTAENKGNPSAIRKFQNEQDLCPNYRTYIIFIEHHVTHTGELYKISALLEEMLMLGIPIHGRIFMELFRGFAGHGGVRLSPWNQSRLESVWHAFLDLHNQGKENVYVSKWVAIWAIRAFAKCTTDEATFKVIDELKRRWQDEESDFEVVRGYTSSALQR